MKKRFMVLGLVLILVGLIFGKMFFEKKYGKQYIPSFKVIGDIEECLVINNIEEFWDIKKIEYKDNKMKAVKLEDIINFSKPISEDNNILLVGSDGLISEISGDTIEECYITFSSKNGWESINYNHPVSSNIKKTQEIVVVSNTNSWNYGLNIINQEENLVNITPGQAYFKASIVYPHFEGKSSVTNDNKTYDVSVYTKRKVFELSNIIDLNKENKILVMSENGDYRFIDGEGYFEIKDNYFNYIYPNMKNNIEKVNGVIINPSIGRKGLFIRLFILCQKSLVITRIWLFKR